MAFAARYIFNQERIDLEDDPHVALAALARHGPYLQASQYRRGRLGQDWHPSALSTPFYWACIEYKPTGETRFGGVGTEYQYTGQFNQAALGLYYYGARWYDSSLGRFAQPDGIVPLASQGVQAWDRYAFVNNNALRYVDPSGHDLEQIMFDNNYDKYGPPKKIEKRESEVWSRWLLKYGGATPVQLTVEQKIGKAITAFIVEVVIVLPIDFALISLTTQVPGLGLPGILVEGILVPADFFVTDFAISFPYATYLDVSTGYENDFEWILTNIIVSELPQDWQDNIRDVVPGMIH